jgi:hypothetical protein
MPTFSGGNAAFTPATTQDCWTLDAATTAGTIGNVRTFAWGGSGTTSSGYRTRWTRPTTRGTGGGTVITLGYNNPNYTTAALFLYSAYTTSQSVLAADPSGNLHRQDWNVQGGQGYIALPLANPWMVSSGILQSTIACRNTLGTDANLSSYHVMWDEGP